jgi:hypothetical protein
MPIVRGGRLLFVGYAICPQAPLVPDLNHCMSIEAMRRRRRLRMIDEHSERHGDG